MIGAVARCLVVAFAAVGAWTTGRRLGAHLSGRPPATEPPGPRPDADIEDAVEIPILGGAQ